MKKHAKKLPKLLTINLVAIMIMGIMMPIVSAASKFDDVPQNTWFTESVAWASSKGITTGVSPNSFAPNRSVTRGEFVTFLYRAAGSPKTTNAVNFPDVASTSLFYFAPVNWAASTGITTGFADKTFKPNDNITREQLATMLFRFAKYKAGNVNAPTNVLDKFPDSSSVSSFAREGMRWAVHNKIITGNAGRILPKDSATRAETVTMLHRYLGTNTPSIFVKGILNEDVNLLNNMIELGVKRVILNITMSRVFDTRLGHGMDGLDAYIDKLNANGIAVTAVILNDFPSNASQTHRTMLPVGAPVQGAAYYQFNSTTQAGREAIRNVAKDLATRYKNKVTEWVIGNEINDWKVWNYYPDAAANLQGFVNVYTDTFKIFYDEITKVNQHARVFTVFDMRWNVQSDTGISGRHKVKDMLPLVNKALQNTNYGIAWHPYPENHAGQLDFANANVNARNDVNTPIINFKNLSVLTDYMQRSEMLSPAGTVRNLILSEFGFCSSYNTEAQQAAALRQAYELAKSNPYVQGFYLNRLMDAPAEGRAYGLLRTDRTKKPAYDVYKDLK